MSLLLLIVSKCLLAQGIFTSQEALDVYKANLELFSDDFACEQQGLNAAVHLAPADSPCASVNPFNPPVLPTPPPNPAQPPAGPLNSLPFVIVNNSGIPDNEVFLTIIGAQLNGTVAQTQKIYVTFMPGGIGVYQLVPSSGSGSIPPVALNTLLAQSEPHTYAFYIPNNGVSEGISGARIYFQMKNNTPLITYSSGALTEPSVLNQSLASYSITFDKYEFAYVPAGSPQIAADATAVDFFSIPLYGYLSTPAQHSGLYQSQSFIMGSPNGVVPTFFNNKCTGASRAAILAQWNNLFSPNQSSPIRVLSPASAMSVGTASSFPNKFDPNYFDNASAYGFSLLQYLWSGVNAYYKTGGNGLYFQIPPSSLYPQPSGGVYTASIDGSNNMNFSPAFTTESQSFFPAPSTANATAPSPTNGPTSYLIFAAENLNSTFAANLQGNQVSKLFEEAMIAGLLPFSFSPSNPLSNGYLAANAANYYNPNLPSSAGGPWYSVYAQALHYCGPIYAFGFDEPLYPNVLMESPTLTPSTYIGITIGLCDLVP